MMLKQWNWRGCYQWSTLTTVVIILVIYNTSANMWLLRQPYILPQNPSTLTSTSPSSPYEETTPSSSVDDPLARLDLRLGRWDYFHAFKSFDYAAMGDLYPEISGTRKVCLATQCSIDSLHEILNIAAHWTGPISLAVFIVGEEMKLLQAFIMWLLVCQPETYSRLALHITTPSYRMAVLGTMPDWARKCSEQPSFSNERINETEVWRAHLLYPQNLLRNLARKNCHTPYIYLVDVDIVPSKGMAEALDQFIATNQFCRKCAYVIPTYELDWSADFPSNKSELLHLIKKGLAVPFHKKVFRPNQYASNLNRWEATHGYERNRTHVSHDVTHFQLGYEPFYVAPDSVPPYDERFMGYGFTRNTQAYEMFLVGYKFKVLSPIFTIHWGLQSIKTRPQWRTKQISRNYKKFLIFKKELYVRYGRDPLGFFSKKPQLLYIKNKKF